MGSYYYLAAQLPYLVYGQGVPITSSAFKAMAVEAMGSAAGAALDYCTLDPAPSNHEAASKPGVSPFAEASGFIDRWREWEGALRLNLAKMRAQKLKRESAADAPDYPADAVSAAKTALGMESPLEAELFLDKARWNAIENFQGIDSFGENAMYAYLLKLLLMERRSAFRAEEGFSEYKGLYAAILGGAGSASGAGFARESNIPL